ncbi:hypothetical protein [Microbacterium sp. 22242]|uniref:hypothetical protein n=1 Tax=Microbacterium sp. 22242 TaxID=3453896 RepID=UPI003F87688A
MATASIDLHAVLHDVTLTAGRWEHRLTHGPAPSRVELERMEADLTEVTAVAEAIRTVLLAEVERRGLRLSDGIF